MNWSDFYLICFAVGFLFSVLSLLLGSIHWHLPHWMHIPHGHVGPAAHAGHVAAHGHQAGGEHAAREFHVSFFNPATIAAFLAWFGGTGYLLSRYSTIWFAIGLAIALCSGSAGAAIIYLFLSRVLMSEDENMDAADYEMVGVLGRISVPIREGGTGEIIYSQAGTRRTCGARSEKGEVIPKGSEVVVTQYERGIAYVRLWNDIAEDPASDTDEVRKKPVSSTEKATTE